MVKKFGGAFTQMIEIKKVEKIYLKHYLKESRSGYIIIT